MKNRVLLNVFVEAVRPYCRGGINGFIEIVMLIELLKDNVSMLAWFGVFFRSGYNKLWLEEICHIEIVSKGQNRQLRYTQLSTIQMNRSLSHPGVSCIKSLDDDFVAAVVAGGGAAGNVELRRMPVSTGVIADWQSACERGVTTSAVQLKLSTDDNRKKAATTGLRKRLRSDKAQIDLDNCAMLFEDQYTNSTRKSTCKNRKNNDGKRSTFDTINEAAIGFLQNVTQRFSKSSDARDPNEGLRTYDSARAF